MSNPAMPFASASCAVFPDQQKPAFEVGTLVDRYELITKIAEGGMAVVWLARMAGSFGFEKLVALKTIRPCYAEDLAYHRMFRDESDIAARVRHPNVVEVHDVGVHRGVPFQALEWIDGEALAGLHRVALRRGKLISPLVALKIVAQVCAGLSAVHQLSIEGTPQRIVHRDVSPQNVLVSQEGQVKLIDFGIAKGQKRLSEETRTGMIKGKLRYIAPEQARGEAVDHRADIWACGVMLHQLLVGTTPLRSRAQQEAHAEALPAVSLLERLDPEIRAVLAKALAEDPEGRFSSAREMEVELERLAQRNGPITAADIARAVEPLREQRAARIVVIESALDASRKRRSLENSPAEMNPPETKRAHISLVPAFTNTMISAGIAPTADEPGSFVSLSASASPVSCQSGVLGQHQALGSSPNQAAVPAQLAELWKEFIRSLKGVSAELLRQSQRFAQQKLHSLTEKAQRFPRAMKLGLLFCAALVLMSFAYGSGYQSGFRESGATVVSGPINISLKDVPVCQITIPN